MDNELQQLLRILYGDRKMNDKALASYTKQWDSDHNGFRTTIRNAASDKIKQQAPVIVDSKAAQVKPTLMSVQHDAENIKPIEPKRAANDMSAIANFKEAFRQARQGGHKTFFWKKTKANPSGMFSTDMATEGGNSQKANKVFADIDKTDLPIFTGEYQNPLPDVTSARIPVQGPINHEQIDDPNFVPRIPIQGKTDLPIFNKQQPVEVNITGNNSRVAGRRYGEGQKNANLYFGRKGAGMFSAGGNIQGQSGLVDTIIDALNSSADIQTINNIIQKSGQNPETIIKEIVSRAQGGDQAAAMAFSNLEKLMKNSTVAKLGTKLNYIQKLKGICPEGTEKIYLKNGGCMCKQKAQKGAKTKMPTEYNEKRHERLAIGEAMGKNNKAQQDSLQTYRNLYNKKSASDKYKMGDQDPHGKNPKKKVQEKGCGGKTSVKKKK